jgi:hypothetical protein
MSETWQYLACKPSVLAAESKLQSDNQGRSDNHPQKGLEMFENSFDHVL